MASFPVSTLLTFCMFVYGITAQNGVTTELLENGATTARGTTLVLRVVVPIGTAIGEWHRSQSALPSSRRTFRTVGQFQEVELIDVEDSDAGTYYYIPSGGGSIIEGTVVVVESVVNGSWSMWNEGTVTACPVTCGGSTRTRTRTRSCNNPAPMYGGYTCRGDSETLQQEPCGTEACNEPTQRILDLGTNMVAYRGQSVTFRFAHSSTSGQASWFKFGSGPILENDKYKLSSSGTTDFLTIENVQDSDAGTFFFSKGSASGTGIMTVENDPAQRILDLGSNMVAYRGETVTIRFEHTSDSGQTNWFKARDGPLSNSDKYNMYSSGNVEYLTISNVQDSDADRYIFYKGSATQQGTLTVEDLVNGAWSPWSVGTVTACPVTCGGSTRTRTRTRACNNPAPANGGNPCSGNAVNITEEPCGTDACSGQVVNGAWSPWTVGTVTACPVTCGGSTRTRTRTRSCNNPAPANGGNPCPGNPVNIAEEPCGTNACNGQVVNGAWGPWTVGLVTACPVTCGGSTRTRTRTRSCNNPAPANGGNPCPGNPVNIAEEPCGTNACNGQVVNGAWGPWTVGLVTACPVTCGGSTRTRTRTRSCNNPAPANGGNPCPGNPVNITEEPCGTDACNGQVVNGAWSPWTVGTVTACPVTCGGSTRTRTRTRSCNNPAPANGGNPCPGNPVNFAEEPCGTDACNGQVVNGAWGPWTVGTVTACPVTCGGSTRTRTRTRSCNNPAPANGGNPCSGNPVNIAEEPCGTNACSEPPQRIQDLNNNPVAYRGQSVTLRVQHSSTSGQATWFKIGSGTISNNAKYRMSSTGTTDFLTINDVQDSDAGNYIFTKGSANGQGTLAVEDAPPEGICAGAIRKNGVGYRYHPTECDKYIQCFYSTDGQVLANYGTCPFGHYWNMMTFRCDEYWKVDNCPVEKCNSSCGVTIKAAGSCGAYWDCSVIGPRPVCCPAGYGFFRGRGCLPTLSSGEETCPSFYACRDSCQKRPVWTNSNNYEIFAGSQGWVEMECEDGMYFDIGDCGCIKRDVPCDSVRNYNFNSNNFGGDIEATSVTSDGNSIAFNDNSRFSINVRNIPTGSPRIVRFRYQHSGSTSELLSMTNTQGHQTVAVYSGEDGLHFKFTAWTNCEEELMVSTKGMPTSDWKVVTLWYDGKHMTAIVTSGQIKNRARIYAPNIVFLDNRIHLGTSDSVRSASYTGNMMETVPFDGRFDYVMIDVCDGGLLV